MSTTDVGALNPQPSATPARVRSPVPTVGTRTRKTRRAAALDVSITLAIALVVAGPALFTQSGFAVDFTNGLWLGWVQGHAVAHGLHPTYFVNTNTGGIFNPVYAFYGGTLFTALGALDTVLLGRAVLALDVLILVGVISAQGGFTWLARQCGARGLLAHAPGLVFVSSAYYVTDLYGRGDLPEFMAVSMIPLVLASGANLLRGEHWKPLGVAVFVASTVLVTGSHNITLLWGAVVLAVAAGILMIMCRPVSVSWRRVGAVVALAALCVCVNAWFLLIVALHAGDVGASRQLVPWGATSFFDTPAVLFDPLREVPFQSGTPALYVQAPVWFLVWAIAALLWTRRPVGEKRLWRAGLSLGATLAILLVVIMTSPPWDLMPAALRSIQFAYRLNSYVALAVGGMVLVGVLGVQRTTSAFARGARRLRYGLAAVALVSMGLCVWQLWVPEDRMTNPDFPRGWSYADRHEALIAPTVYPRTWYAVSFLNSYADASEPVVTVPAGRSLTVNPALVSHDRVSATLALPSGSQPIATNVLAGPYLVAFHGVQQLGRTADGHAVVRRLGAGAGPVRIVIETAMSASVRIGRAVSLIALLNLVLLIALVALRARKLVERQADEDTPHCG